MSQPLTNRLLDSLSPAVKADFLKLLEPVALPLRTVMFEAGQTPRYAYFLTSGLASVVTVMGGGDAVEMGLTGREGLPRGFIYSARQGAIRGASCR